MLKNKTSSAESPNNLINKRLVLLEEASKKFFIKDMCHFENTESYRLSDSYTKFADLPRDVLKIFNVYMVE